MTNIDVSIGETVIDQTRRAWAYLSRVAEPPCPGLAEFVARVGPVEAADRIRRGAVDAELGECTAARRDVDTAAKDLELLYKRNGRLLTPDDDEWPTLAFTSFSGKAIRGKPQGRAPLVLWVIGAVRVDHIAQRSAAIVGTRAATAYGEHVAADLSAELVERDVSIISGGAYGIDGVAHRATLASEGLTAAVLAAGIDMSYPAGHSALFHRIGKSGVLISEYPPGVVPARHRFLTRNRLVAALSTATVVVEAGLRSGAANTAAWARALGRVVCAVPGPVTSGASAGCHNLLRSGAELVTRAEEVLEIIGRAGELASDEVHPSTPLDTLTDVELQVFEALPARGWRTPDEIAVAAGLPAARVLGALALLDIARLVQCEDGRWRVRRPVM